MTRLMIVYTLKEGTDERRAIEELEKTRDELPEGAFLEICRRSEPGMDAQLRWMPFGDLVQIMNFPHAWQAQEFDDSEAYESQNRRTKGFFSNIASVSCTVVPD